MLVFMTSKSEINILIANFTSLSCTTLTQQEIGAELKMDGKKSGRIRNTKNKKEMRKRYGMAISFKVLERVCILFYVRLPNIRPIKLDNGSF